MKSKFIKIIIVLIITAATHTLAVTNLPQDFDEPAYTEAAMDYARASSREISARSLITPTIANIPPWSN
ncbi:MAG: hypothetical protein M0C28_19705 [Candidatus Moduliflexus flocculans]|nr:hypothetical protein [Candidatus Moduliflexus flocculans]MCK7580542.1 hypothetical protein [Chromatiales bacterium]